MPTVTVYSLGGTWTSAPTFTYTSGVTLEERLNYTDNNGAHDNILDDMFGVGRTNQQGHTSDPTGDADAGTQAIGQTTLFGMNVNGWSSAMFRKRRTDNDEQTTEAGRDYHEVEAS